MKIFIIIFIFLLPFTVLAENYSCSYDYYGELRPVSLKRNLSYETEFFERCDMFFEDCSGGVYYILEETVSTIYLGNTLIDGGYQLTIVDKENLMFRTVNLYDPVEEIELSAVIQGRCLLN